jgi:diguanylate cyclase (GGDEF)-like protein
MPSHPMTPDTLAPSSATPPGYVLLVEDNPGDARLTRGMLDEDRTPGQPVLMWVQTLAAATERLATHPDCMLVLLDLGLPDGQGLEALMALKVTAPTCPIVVLTGDDDERIGTAAVHQGAQDYLVKGSFDAGLLRRCMGFAMERKRMELKLVAQSLHDELTGLPRRALLLDRLQEALKHAKRDTSMGALLFIDLDYFKQINDHYGHAAGDAVLQAVSLRLQGGLRVSDTAARIGGDEFVVLLPHVASPQDAMALGEKLRLRVAQPLAFAQHQLTIGASMGVACFGGAHNPVLGNADELMQQADAAMYAAKAAGRGTVRKL